VKSDYVAMIGMGPYLPHNGVIRLTLEKDMQCLHAKIACKYIGNHNILISLLYTGKKHEDIYKGQIRITGIG
jgi:hypothetical protein